MNRCKNDKADETRMIRFIDPNYREMFQIPDGAYVEVKYPSRRLRKMSVPGSWVIRAIYMYRYQKMAMITSYTIPIFQSGMAARWIRMAP